MYWYCTCVRQYFRQFLVSFKKFQNYVLFYQEPETAPDKKIPGAGAAPKQADSKTLLGIVHILAIFYTVIDLKHFFWELSVVELKLFNYSITFFLILFPAPFRALYCHNSSNEIPVCLNCGRNYFFFILSVSLQSVFSTENIY